MKEEQTVAFTKKELRKFAKKIWKQSAKLNDQYYRINNDQSNYSSVTYPDFKEYIKVILNNLYKKETESIVERRAYVNLKDHMIDKHAQPNDMLPATIIYNNLSLYMHIKWDNGRQVRCTNYDVNIKLNPEV